jgi:hypothetical protein
LSAPAGRQKDQDATPPSFDGRAGANECADADTSIVDGFQKYTNFSSVRILAIYVVPHDPGPLLRQ